MVIKKDGSRVPYNRDKVLIGLQKACYKRPVSEEVLERLVDDLEEQLLAEYDREVPSRVIGELVMRRLKEVDKVAYVRFASVYREFRDVGEFINEVEDVIRSSANSPAQQELFDDKPQGRADLQGGKIA